MHALLTTTKASVTSAALLLAVDYMDRFQKANRSATNMRTQIKGYLADAANAKLLYDEEKKRSESYAREISELKDRAQQSVQPSIGFAEEHDKNEFDETPDGWDTRPNQLERADQLVKNIWSQDIVYENDSLKRDREEYMDRIGKQSEQISQLEQQLQQKQEEISRLQGELKTLEDMINEDLAAARESFLSSGAGSFVQFDAKDFGGQRAYDGAAEGVLPPLYRPDPLLDATYDFEDPSNDDLTESLL